jgi:hypothetical protein
LSAGLLASLWLPACFIMYVFCEGRFSLRMLFAGVTLMAAAVGTLMAIHRLLN